jgi:hypothetical protein
MKDSATEFKMRLAEEIEFELMVALRSGNPSLVPGLERALSIIEEME